MSDPKESIIQETNKVLTLAEQRINTFIKNGGKDKEGSTEMSKDFVKETGLSFAFVSSIVSLFIKRHDLVTCKRGKGGGLQLK